MYLLYLVQRTQLNSVYVVHQTEVCQPFKIFAAGVSGQFEDYGLVVLLGKTRLEYRIQDICIWVSAEIQHKKIEEVISESKSSEVIPVNACSQNVERRIFSYVYAGLTHSVRTKRSHFHETEAEIVQVVVEFAVFVKTRAKSHGIIEVQAEQLPLQAFRLVAVHPAVDGSHKWNPAYEAEIFQAYFGGLFQIHLLDEGAYDEIVETHMLFRIP